MTLNMITSTKIVQTRKTQMKYKNYIRVMHSYTRTPKIDYKNFAARVNKITKVMYEKNYTKFDFVR